MLPSCCNHRAVFVYWSVASWEHLLGKWKIHSELWTTKSKRTKKKNCPQPVRSTRSNPRIVPGFSLKPLGTGAGCKQPQHAWLTGLPVSHGCMNTLTRQLQTGTLYDGRSKARKWWFESQCVDTSKSRTDLGFSCLQITFKAIKLSTLGTPPDNCQILAFATKLPKFLFLATRPHRQKL